VQICANPSGQADTEQPAGVINIGARSNFSRGGGVNARI